MSKIVTFDLELEDDADAGEVRAALLTLARDDHPLRRHAAVISISATVLDVNEPHSERERGDGEPWYGDDYSMTVCLECKQVRKIRCGQAHCAECMSKS